VAALPGLEQAAAQLSSTGVPVTVTGVDALAAGGGGGGAGVLAETLFGGVGALVVLVVVFGSFLALTPLLVAAGSILTTFLIVWGLTGLTEVSFIVQYLLSLIGLGVWWTRPSGRTTSSPSRGTGSRLPCLCRRRPGVAAGEAVLAAAAGHPRGHRGGAVGPGGRAHDRDSELRAELGLDA